jgi:hypothetical protein
MIDSSDIRPRAFTPRTVAESFKTRVFRRTVLGASPSSRFLVSTKNLFRGQGVPELSHRAIVATLCGAADCSCFGRVIVNNSG